MSQQLLTCIKHHLAKADIVLPFPVALETDVKQAEIDLGFHLPFILTNLYREIGNGGFGPGLGLIGVKGGAQSDFGDIVATFNQLKNDQLRAGRLWDNQTLPFCSWGCNIFCCVECDSTNRISIFEDFRLWPKNYNIEDFFRLWMNGTDILLYDSSFDERTVEFMNPFTRLKETKKTRQRRK
jgi:hypothetical protein